MVTEVVRADVHSNSLPYVRYSQSVKIGLNGSSLLLVSMYPGPYSLEFGFYFGKHFICDDDDAW